MCRYIDKKIGQGAIDEEIPRLTDMQYPIARYVNRWTCRDCLQIQTNTCTVHKLINTQGQGKDLL